VREKRDRGGRKEKGTQASGSEQREENSKE
jgi:hypothetical protein